MAQSPETKLSGPADMKVGRAPARVLQLWPQGHFPENMTARDGKLYVTDYYGCSVYTFTPTEGLRLFTTLHTSPLDLAFDEDGVAVVSAHDKNAKAGPVFMESNAFWLLHPDGTSERLAPAPEGRFVNGIVRQSPGIFLAADSYAGVIWRIDRAAGAVERFAEHDLFRREDETSFDPALNGLKLKDGYIYASNTTRALILRMQLNARGIGEVEVVAEQLRCDDFTFGASGRLYAAGQGYQVTRLDPDGAQTVIATAEDKVFGATSAHFGATEEDADTLYITATGGAAMGLTEQAAFVALTVEDRAPAARLK